VTITTESSTVECSLLRAVLLVGLGLGLGSVWLVSCYAHVIVLLQVVIVTLISAGGIACCEENRIQLNLSTRSYMVSTNKRPIQAPSTKTTSFYGF